MQKQYPAFLHKISTLGVLGVLCLFMAGSCPLKKLIAGFGTVTTEMAPQAKPLARTGSSVLSCSTEHAVARTALPDLQKPAAKSLGAFPLFAALFIVPGAIVRVLHAARYRYGGRFVSPIPLFLKNHTLLL